MISWAKTDSKYASVVILFSNHVGRYVFFFASSSNSAIRYGSDWWTTRRAPSHAIVD